MQISLVPQIITYIYDPKRKFGLGVSNVASRGTEKHMKCTVNSFSSRTATRTATRTSVHAFTVSRSVGTKIYFMAVHAYEE